MSRRSQSRGRGGELQRIEVLEQRKLAEQEEYREIITAAEAASDAETVSARIRELGWQGMLDLMSELRFPPCHTDWKCWLGLDWRDIPHRRKLDGLEDQELASRIYFYGETADHTERLKAMACFAQTIGMSCTHAVQVFELWSQRAVLCEVLRHVRQSDSPLAHHRGSLEAMLETIDLMGDIVCEDADGIVRISSALECLIAEVEAEESV